MTSTMAPPTVPSIHRRTNSSASRDGSPPPHVSTGNLNNMTIERPSHLQRRSSSRSSPKRPPRSSHVVASSNTAATANTRTSRRIPRHSPSYQNYTFQHPRYNMGLSLRYPPANRISFLPSPHPTCSSLQSLLNDMERLRGSRLTSSSLVSGESSNPCRISPSPGGVEIWERQKILLREGRHLSWRGMQGCDPWFDPFHSKDRSDASSDDASHNRYECSQYKPLNPYDEIDKLPSHSPILTIRKRRLPNRADVGFANPTEEEIRTKMAEVQKECEWQECSPRICCLTGFYLPDASSTSTSFYGDGVEGNSAEVHSLCRDQLEAWNGGRIPGIPWAGRDLIDCYKKYQVFEEEYRSRQMNKGNNNSTNSSNKKSSRKVQYSPASKTTRHMQQSERERMKDPRTYSMFAPPLDSIPSKSKIWKLRPFVDRPPGIRYFVACPCDLRTENDDEPLFCSMALYLLPRDNEGANTTRGQSKHDVHNLHDKFKGKISEDFYFPAGNWDSLEGPSEEQSWRRRKRRAVFSYDPLDCEEDNLCLVIQVFRAARGSDGVMEEIEVKKKGLGNKLKGTFKKSKSKTDIAAEGRNNQNTLDVSHGKNGPRFLSPVCFSVVAAFPTDDPTTNQQWPVGETMRTPFYSYPDELESQEDFVDRLLTLSRCQIGQYSSSTDGNFRSYAQVASVKKLVPRSGHVDIFTSHLGQDFTQVLLQEPPELADLSEDGPSANPPQLLVDVMGESAIEFDGSAIHDTNVRRLRSNLRRLPPTPASGYTSSFDIKEVLYMPPRLSPRKYEEDAGLSSTSCLNLLYIYPRLIRTVNESDGDSKTLSLRIGVVEQELHEQSLDETDRVYQPLQSVYNPSSPAGLSMIESYYTKLIPGKPVDCKGGRRSVLLKDEVKIRLPDILDRRHFLQFSLFAVNDALDCSVVAETTVPFIISSKESTTGSRVTTIIPNGLHRIQLGDSFQIHVETRLASSFHISDAAVATILRDFPLSSLAEDSSKLPSISPFVNILSMASGQSIKRHFLSLVTVQVLGLVNQSCPKFYYESLFDKFGSDIAWNRLVACNSIEQLASSVKCLFEVLEKTKTCFGEKDDSIIPIKFLQWIKSFVDSFDEKLFLLHGDAKGESVNLSDAEQFELNDSLDPSGIYLKDSKQNSDIPELKTNLSMVSRNSTMSMIRSPRRGNRGSAVFEAPFSRKAFVATKAQQLHADAELLDYQGEYFDDDQTVATYVTTTSRMTFATITSRKEITSKSHTVLENRNSIAEDSTSNKFGFTTPPRRSPSSDSASTPFSFAGKRAEYMANRVNTMAQLVMAPCIAPTLPDGTTNGTYLNNTSSKGPISDSNFRSDKKSVEPGSDIEEEGETKSFVSLRGNQSCLNKPPLVFQVMTSSKTTSCLYEVITSLWVHSWTSFAVQLKGERHLKGSSATVPVWPCEVINGTNNPSAEEKIAVSFIRNISFFLPMIAKSLATRCLKCETTPLVIPMTFLDDSHMQIFVPFVETITIGTMREAISGSSGVLNADRMLVKALSTAHYMLDFLIGLFPCLHPSQVSTLLNAHFSMLEECEKISVVGLNASNSADKENLRRVKCARLLRLHAVEKLAAIPKFVALNFTPKYSSYCHKKNAGSSSWTHQIDSNSDNSGVQTSLEKIDRYPQSCWLSGLLMAQCLSIALRCCKTLIIEAKAQLRVNKYGNNAPNRLSQGDLLSLEAIAFQAVSCAHECLIKRHSIDSRFQSIENNTRVAALFVEPVLEQSVLGLSVLSRLEPNNKIRSCWVLCLLYILQEAPEVLLRDKLRSLFRHDNYHINEFVSLLSLGNVTLQHLAVPSDIFGVLGEKTNEMMQESFNCLSASIILVVDECDGNLVTNVDQMNKLAKAVFDALLHMLTTPQSSVTLLRALGGAAHAFDKFGPSVFLQVVGTDIQNWGRVIFSLMNSTELSVRSMSVDFAVSMIGGIYYELGSVDNVCLAFLTVLPEVAAREIALYHQSGLTTTVDDIEATLWPIRRAFADIEETDPEDDDRVDLELVPHISTFCRTGQAILDGVLVEIRLKQFDPTDLFTSNSLPSPASRSKDSQDMSKTLFDADEESILEAATYFCPETGLIQKIRWLLTLRDLHISKSQWAEAAETLISSAISIIESLPHLSKISRPWSFNLWHDPRRSPWLQVQDNGVIAKFASSFLEPIGLTNSSNHLSVETICSTLCSIVDQAFLAFDQEGGMQAFAYNHFEKLLDKLLPMIANQEKEFRSQEIVHIRRARGSICGKLARLDKDVGIHKGINSGCNVYVRVILRGKKPARFRESTTIPTYFEWNMPSICRVPMHLVLKAQQALSNSSMKTEDDCICSAFAEKYISALRDAGSDNSVIMRIGASNDVPDGDPNTYLDIAVVQMKKSQIKSRKFYLRSGNNGVVSFGITEFTVAHKCPHTLSRQRSLTNNLVSTTSR